MSSGAKHRAEAHYAAAPRVKPTRPNTICYRVTRHQHAWHPPIIELLMRLLPCRLPHVSLTSLLCPTASDIATDPPIGAIRLIAAADWSTPAGRDTSDDSRTAPVRHQQRQHGRRRQL